MNVFRIFGFLEASGIELSALSSFKLAKPQMIGSESSCSFEEWIEPGGQLRLVRISN